MKTQVMLAHPAMSDQPKKLVCFQFVERMEAELRANEDKGDWRAWKPSELDALADLDHHKAKLTLALRQPREARHVVEFAADLANIAMKIAEVFGPKGKPRACAACGSTDVKEFDNPDKGFAVPFLELECAKCGHITDIGDDANLLEATP